MEQENVNFSSHNQLEEMTDEELITYVKQGNNQALDLLMDRYKELVNIKVSRYYMAGAEREDIVQEGLIGLFKAIKNFDAEKNITFKTFANVCIERQLITAIKASNRQKHIPLNSYLSLNTTGNNNDEDGDKDMFDTLVLDVMEDPLDMLTKKEYYQSVEDIIENTLSDFEKKVLDHYMRGQSYVQIAEELDSPVKSVDNAIQRIRKKALKNMEEDDL